MDGKLGLYLWLIDALRCQKMTLAEIKDKWNASSRNIDRTELTDRTFHRYRENTAAELGVYIECNKKAGNVYYIKESLYDDTNMQEWLLSAFRISTMAQRMKQHDKIMLDKPPQPTPWLDAILDAIDDRQYIKIDYESVYGVKSTCTLAPSFVRLFRRRWYIVGCERKTHAIKIFAINRIAHLETLKEKVRAEKIPTPEEFFRDCFGIIKEEGQRPEKIRLRAFWPQYIFLEETPLHHSQRMLTASEDGEYREYEVKVQPTFDFKQELLKNSRGLIVLEPEWLKNEMVAVLKDMIKGYETGEDYSREGKGHDAAPGDC